MAITVDNVRGFLRDRVEYNLLLDAYQFTDDEITDAKRFAIAEYNAMTPVTSVEESNFPNDWILLMGTAAHLMWSEAFHQLRNQATYNDGDVERIGLYDKFAAYAQACDRLRAEWKQVAQKVKQQNNMEGMYGSLSSGYRFIRPGNRNY